MEITAQMVKELRETSGAGMMDCKKALTEAKGDMEKAIDLLREKGLGQAAKKADRLASEGLVSVAISDDFKLATILEINSETDFVAKNAQFQELVKTTNEHIQSKDIKNLDELKNSQMDGTSFEEFFKGQVATIGENLVVRRFETIKADETSVVNGYVHSNGRVAVIIGAKCDSAKTASEISELLRNLSMHAAAMKPTCISYNDFDRDFVEKETVALRAELEKENDELKRLGKHLNKIPTYVSKLQITDEVLKEARINIENELRNQKKPEQIWDKIIPGQMDRFLADNTILDQRLTLLGQFYVMDDKKTIEEILKQEAQKLNGSIEITSYIRFEVGEGLEKKNEDFAAEVAAQIG